MKSHVGEKVDYSTGKTLREEGDIRVSNKRSFYCPEGDYDTNCRLQG